MATFSASILSIVSETRGEIPPTQLRNFLLQVRGRKKALEIASHFTSNIPGLVRQLKKVETNYYKKGRRGAKMDKDIQFIKRLCTRLLKDNEISDSDEDDTCERHHHNENIYQAIMLTGGRTEAIFASTSSCTQRVTENPTTGIGSLSSGTVNIIHRTGGKLPPMKLCTFLNEVRGKKGAVQIASRFTSDIPALVNQLQKVKENYKNQGRKGVRMDRDIDFIRRLSVRLQNERHGGYMMEEYRREIYFP